MTVLFAVAGLLWLCVLIYLTPSVWAIFKGDMRRGDPPRLAAFGFALLSVLGALRWLFAPEDTQLLAAVFSLNICVAALTLLISKVYGRGDGI